MKLLPLANSLATAVLIFWVICAILIWILPGFSLYLTKTQLMGLQGISFTGWNLDFTTFFVGGIFAVIATWIFGYIWGRFYQKFSREE